jgi:hypothetical protein
MSSMQTLPITPLEHSSLDFAALRAEGIRLLERLAGHAWTDFNVHDPGITLLEQVCYAITELGYRATYGMPDLLAGSEDPCRSLYSARAILPTEPVTLLDLRKLVLDVKGVRDAWIEPIATPSPALVYHEGQKELRLEKPKKDDAPSVRDRYTTPVELTGLFRVLIAPSAREDVDEAALRRDVLDSLHAHRPLCMDFTEILLLKPEKISVNARIEIAAGAAPQDMLVAIYEKIAEHLAPSIRFRTLGDMVAAGKSIDEIFSGPRLSRGFVDSEEIARRGRKTELHTSDLLRDLMDIPGVRVVHDVALNSDLAGGKPPEPWKLVLHADRSPQFDVGPSVITLVRDGVEILVTVPLAVAEYRGSKKIGALPASSAGSELDRVPPVGRDRHTARYTSIMNQLPACYGVGAVGLPDGATPERKAQQKQLRGYLLFFDQLLCNAFAQLGHVPTLFAFDGQGTRTYASQPVDDEALDLDELRIRPKAEHEAWLQEFANHPEFSPSSRGHAHRFLDHLLARFAETHPAYPTFPLGAKLSVDPQARDKRAFLQAYPRISAARGTALNIFSATAPTDRSGLAERIERRLGLFAKRDDTKPEEASWDEEFLVIEHILLRPIEEDVNQLGDYEIAAPAILAKSPLRDPYSLQLTFVFPSWPARFADAGFRTLVEQTVRAETPAHIVTYMHWLPQADFASVRAAYGEWLSWYKNYWLEKHGL